MKIYHCSYWGDIELESVGTKTMCSYSKLTVAEHQALAKLCKQAKHTPAPSLVDSGTILLPWPLAKTNTRLREAFGAACHYLIGFRAPDPEVPVRVAEADTPAASEAAVAAAEPETVAAEVKKPTRGCPLPVAEPEKEQRAMRVLRLFLTDAQRRDFDRCRAFSAIGRDTGRIYRLTSRWAREVERYGVLFDLDERHTICAKQEGVPPAEELLALKWSVEHFEEKFLNSWGAPLFSVPG